MKFFKPYEFDFFLEPQREFSWLEFPIFQEKMKDFPYFFNSIFNQTKQTPKNFYDYNFDEKGHLSFKFLFWLCFPFFFFQEEKNSFLIFRILWFESEMCQKVVTLFTSAKKFLIFFSDKVIVSKSRLLIDFFLPKKFTRDLYLDNKPRFTQKKKKKFPYFKWE